MLNRQIAYYLGSKLLAALLNLLTIALFVRLGGAEVYGSYLIVLAWAYIVYGCSLQWLRFAFFACFRKDRACEFISTYLTALGVAGAGFGLAMTFVALIAPVSLGFALGLFVMVAGLGAYDALHEIARTQLRARTVAAGVLARAALMLALGLLALSYEASQLSLALAVGAAHIGAGVLLFFGAAATSFRATKASELGSLWRYGRALIPAFMFDSAGLQLDRLLLARSFPADTVGSYGAAADFIRQMMIVVAEAINGAYLSFARAEAAAGREDSANRVLGEAFLAYTALTTFGAAFILRFDRLIFDTLYGAEVGAAIEAFLVLIVASNVAGIFRGYYFGQALYLTDKSRVLLFSNLAHLVVVLACGLVAVPAYGTSGAAFSMLAGHLAGCAVFVVAWRNQHVLRLPYAKAGAILSMAILAYAAASYVDPASGGFFAFAASASAFAFAAFVTAMLFNILSFNDFLATLQSSIFPSNATPRSGGR